jgi:hypothetical protein
MFKRLFLKTCQEDRAKVYSAADFYLACLGLFLELFILVFLAFYLAGKLYFWPLSYSELGPFGYALMLLPMCLVYGAVSGISVILRSRLRARFGLDPRPTAARFWAFFKTSLWRLLYFWFSSWAVYVALIADKLAPIIGVLLLVVWGFFVLDFFLTRFEVRRSQRELESDQNNILSEAAKKLYKTLSVRLLASNRFEIGVKDPIVIGSDVIINDNVLAALDAKCFKNYLYRAWFGLQLKIDGKYLAIRLIMMLLSLPFSFMLLNSLGLLLGYPLEISSACLALVWLGVWLALKMSEFMLKLVKRIVETHLYSASTTVSKDFTELIALIEVIADRNLIPLTPLPWWRILAMDALPPFKQIESVYRTAAEHFAEKPSKIKLPKGMKVVVNKGNSKSK